MDTNLKKRSGEFSSSRRKDESPITARIIEVVGDTPVAVFARKAGVGESLMRQYIGGSIPGADKVEGIANAGGVSITWLLTGKGPKDSASSVQEEPASYGKSDRLIKDFLQAMERAKMQMIPELFLVAMKAVERALDISTAKMQADARADAMMKVYMVAYAMAGSEATAARLTIDDVFPLATLLVNSQT